MKVKDYLINGIVLDSIITIRRFFLPLLRFFEDDGRLTFHAQFIAISKWLQFIDGSIFCNFKLNSLYNFIMCKFIIKTSAV